MKKWELKEKQDQEILGLGKVKASGSLWYSPGDGKSSIFLVDSKQTEKKSYAVSMKTWDKLYEEALFAQRLPLLSLQIQDIDLVMMSREDFVNLLKDVQAGKLSFTNEKENTYRRR